MKKIICIFLSAAMLALTACGAASSAQMASSTAQTVTFTDALDREVIIKKILSASQH